MHLALLHPGDLGLTGLMLLLLVLIGIPALVIFVLASAIYKGISVKKESFTVLDLEKHLEPTNENGNRKRRA